MPPRPASTGASRSIYASPLFALLFLAPIYAVVAYLTIQTHYKLPTPLRNLTDESGKAQLSEAAILGYAKHLSENIGYRVVGTAEHAAADAWMINTVENFERQCQEMVYKTGRKLECEVWHQRGSGAHRFDMMGHRVHKTYTLVTNIIMRISDGTPKGKEHAVLVNSHLDSTLMTPGAADDAISVGVMLECIRVLLADSTWEPSNAVIFLFNNAEESLQDGSHLFSTRHYIGDSVRAAINLEAAGSTGPTLLFQATSEEMIQAYSKVPYPFGTVVAADVFKTGIMLSDTDFRQFVQYLDVSGLDIAVVGNSYLYHMRKDLVAHIEPGVAQHMAENALSLIHTLTSSSSSLDELTDGHTPPKSVYFSYLGRFIIYDAGSATAIYVVLVTLSLSAAMRIPDPAPALQGSSFGRIVKSLAQGGVYSLGSTLGAVLGANVLAFLMNAIGRPLSWFAHPWLPLPLYAPPAIAGFLAARLVLPAVEEKAAWTATASLLLAGGTAMHVAGYGSGVCLILSGSPMLISLIPSQAPKLGLWRYALTGAAILATGVQIGSVTLDVFVPLTGRIGIDAPSEHIIASLVAVVGAYSFPLIPALATRFGRRSAARGAMLSLLVTVVVAVIYVAREPFDELHQRRFFAVHMHNTTSGLNHLNLAVVDSATGSAALIDSVSREFAAPGKALEKVEMHEHNADWDVIYPYSAFIKTWRVEIPPLFGPTYGEGANEDQIKLRTIWDVVDDVNGTRSIRLEVNATGVIWPAIAFDAHVLEWSLDDNPPKEYTRHHIKSAMFLGSDEWDIDLVLNASTSRQLAVSHVGIRRNAMWPARKDDVPRDPATELLGRIDKFVEESSRGRVDPTLVSCLGGITVI